MAGLFPRAAVVGIVVLGAGCDVDFFSESGRLGFEAPELRKAGFEDFVSGDPIAVGSRVCPRFDGYRDGDAYHEISDDDDTALRSCFDLAASGPAAFDGECLQIDGPGDIAWVLNARGGTCIGDVSLPDDEVRFEGMELADLVTEEAALVERLVKDEGWTISGDMAPSDLVPAIGAPLVIVEGVVVTARLGLRDPARDLSVAWTDGDAVVTPPEAQVPTYEEAPEQAVLLRLIDGATAEVALQVAGEPAAPLAVESVPADTLTELQVVSFYPTEDEAPIPAILRALARDESGRLVRGVPVEWSLEGDLHTVPLWGDDRDPDYLMVEVGCRPLDEPEMVEHGTVTATLGEEVATLELTWTPPTCFELPEGDDGRPLGPDEGGGSHGRDVPGDQLSCACTSGAGGPSPMGLVLLGGGMAFLRRRRRSRRGIG